MKRAQLSVELMSIITIMFFIFSIFSILVFNRIADMKKEQSFNHLKVVTGNLKTEIDIAESVENGYRREFWLPSKIENYNYNISILSQPGANKSLLVIRFLNYSNTELYYVSIPRNVTGVVYPGMNNITKYNDEICLNTKPCG